MTLYPWLFVIPATATVVIVLYSLALANAKRKKKKNHHHITSIAHTSAIRNLPEYQKARKRYNVLIISAGFFLLLSLISCTIVASRPVSVDLVASEYDNRDIMLCLDVSGSMSNYFEKMIARLRTIVGEMKGERFGITVFDGTPITVVPLSNDYGVIDQALEKIGKDEWSYLSASHYNSNVGSSLIGHGVLGCVTGFDRLDEAERSRSIIVYTDNYASPNQDINIVQAAKYAKHYGITFYGINPSDTAHGQTANTSTPSGEFMRAVTITGGSYYAANATDADMDRIVDQIMEQQAALLEGADKYVKNDTPGISIIIALITVTVYIGIIWSLRL